MTTNNNQGVEKAHYKTKGTRLDLIFFFSNNKRLKALDMMLKGITNTQGTIQVLRLKIFYVLHFLKPRVIGICGMKNIGGCWKLRPQKYNQQGVSKKIMGVRHVKILVDEN